MSMLGVAELIDRVKKEERLSRMEAESKILLSAYGIPVVEEAVVTRGFCEQYSPC